MKLAMFVLAGVLVAVTTGEPKTIYIPDDYAKIQVAIDVAVNGDTIIVRPGTYMENLDFVGKAISLKSEHGPGVTIIDGQKSGSVVSFISGEKKDSVIDGFTIANGTGTYISGLYFGGGIVCHISSPTIVNNSICDNRAADHGGGIACQETANPTILNNNIYNNISDGSGGGIGCSHYSSPLITGNYIHDNSTNGDVLFKGGGGIGIIIYSEPHVINNIIINNTGSRAGGGIFFYYYVDATIANNTITGNTATERGGGLGFYQGGYPVLYNNIVYDNHTLGQDPEIYTSQSHETISYCNVKGGWLGTGNIDADPLWYGPVNGDFHLSQDPCQPWITNPCVDAGDPSSPMIEGTTRTDGIQDAGVVDMGYHYHAIIPFDYLNADTYTLSEATGGTVNFTLTAGASNAKRTYIILGSLSGTEPGQGLPGGLVTLPLNWDLFTDLIITYMNSSFFMNFLGILDPAGDGLAILNTFGPMPPGMAGATMSFAYALNIPWDFVSNPVNIEVIP